MLIKIFLIYAVFCFIVTSIRTKPKDNIESLPVHYGNKTTGNNFFESKLTSQDHEKIRCFRKNVNSAFGTDNWEMCSSIKTLMTERSIVVKTNNHFFRIFKDENMKIVNVLDKDGLPISYHQKNRRKRSKNKQPNKFHFVIPNQGGEIKDKVILYDDGTMLVNGVLYQQPRFDFLANEWIKNNIEFLNSTEITNGNIFIPESVLPEREAGWRVVLWERISQKLSAEIVKIDGKGMTLNARTLQEI